MTDPLPDEIDEDLWNEASGHADAIRRFLKDNPSRTSAADIVRLADELEVSRASVFRLIKLFREGGCAFRGYPATYSDSIRPPVPI